MFNSESQPKHTQHSSHNLTSPKTIDNNSVPTKSEPVVQNIHSPYHNQSFSQEPSMSLRQTTVQEGSNPIQTNIHTQPNPIDQNNGEKLSSLLPMNSLSTKSTILQHEQIGQNISLNNSPSFLTPLNTNPSTSPHNITPNIVQPQTLDYIPSNNNNSSNDQHQYRYQNLSLTQNFSYSTNQFTPSSQPPSFVIHQKYSIPPTKPFTKMGWTPQHLDVLINAVTSNPHASIRHIVELVVPNVIFHSRTDHQLEKTIYEIRAWLDPSLSSFIQAPIARTTDQVKNLVDDSAYLENFSKLITRGTTTTTTTPGSAEIEQNIDHDNHNDDVNWPSWEEETTAAVPITTATVPTPVTSSRTQKKPPNITIDWKAEPAKSVMKLMMDLSKSRPELSGATLLTTYFSEGKKYHTQWRLLAAAYPRITHAQLQNRVQSIASWYQRQDKNQFTTAAALSTITTTSTTAAASSTAFTPTSKQRKDSYSNNIESTRPSKYFQPSDPPPDVVDASNLLVDWSQGAALQLFEKMKEISQVESTLAATALFNAYLTEGKAFNQYFLNFCCEYPSCSPQDLQSRLIASVNRFRKRQQLGELESKFALSSYAIGPPNSAPILSTTIGTRNHNNNNSNNNTTNQTNSSTTTTTRRSSNALNANKSLNPPNNNNGSNL